MNATPDMVSSGPAEARVVVVDPELTVYRVASLRAAWLAALMEGVRCFDLSGVTDIDGAGVQLLCALWRQGRRDDEPVDLRSPSGVVMEALSLMGASRLLDEPARAAGSDRA